MVKFWSLFIYKYTFFQSKYSIFKKIYSDNANKIEKSKKDHDEESKDLMNSTEIQTDNQLECNTEKNDIPPTLPPRPKNIIE